MSMNVPGKGSRWQEMQASLKDHRQDDTAEDLGERQPQGNLNRGPLKSREEELWA